MNSKLLDVGQRGLVVIISLLIVFSYMQVKTEATQFIPSEAPQSSPYQPTPRRFFETVRHTFRQNCVDGSKWGNSYGVTYRTLYLNRGYSYLGWRVIDIQRPWWGNTETYVYQDQYSVY